MLFFKSKKRPEDMTDAEMGARLKHLSDSLDKSKISIPMAALAIGCIGVVAGIFAFALVSGISIPLMIMSGGIGAGAMTLGCGGAARSAQESEIWRLSEENKERVHQVKLRQMRDDAWKQKVKADITIELRKSFDAAISAMAEGKGTSNDIVVKGPLRLKKNADSGPAA